jgi:S-DNA-T family DNA segregation ATPase FtsK/SpoIIIE
VDKVAQRWAASSGQPDTVLGVSADGPLRVNLLADGPHALVAGTTGSGKSDLLQSLVAGLAVLHPPEELTFLLVDYKGGAAFAECGRLPHTAGLVTDLDAQLTRRALRSLDAELRRRERLLAAAGAADLESFRASGRREAVPRLVIVVDEFATLADELPEFVRGLVAVAQRGRSLGVHLVLATQRPGSAVSAEIRANTTLRIALRVTDPAESADIVDAPAAAGIERSRPGRAYLRAGSALTCFQTARVTGRDLVPIRPVVERLDEWRRARARRDRPSGRDDLVRLVDVLRAAAQSTSRCAARSPWLEPLPVLLAATELPCPPDATTIAIGLVDCPAEQTQPPLTMNLTGGSSVLVVGAPGSGRTGALASIALGAAAKLAPDRLEIYVADSAGALTDALSGLPHLATGAGAEDPSVVELLLHRLDTVVTRRVADPRAAGRLSAPRLLVLIDAWDSFLATQDDAAAGRCSELLTALLRAGAASGLTTVVAGGRSLLAPRVAAAFGSRLLLHLADRNDYGLAGVVLRDLPTSFSPGRGVRASDAAEFQLAHVGAGPGVAEAKRATRAVAGQWAAGPRSDTAVRLRPLPSRVRLRELPRDADRLCIGLAGDTAAPVAIDLFSGGRRFLVAGPPRSGRSTTLCVLLVEAHRTGVRAVVAAPGRSPLTTLAHSLGARVIHPDAGRPDVGPVPTARTLLLMDGSEAFLDQPAGEQLAAWARSVDAPLAAVVAGRCDDLATTYRGIAADVRRSHCGLLLRPGPIDGELLGVRLGRRPAAGPPGRGLLIGESTWGPPFDAGEPVPVQVATP